MTTGAVLVLGDINVDVLLPIESYPEPGGDQRSERMVIGVGGSAANSAIALANLGATPHLLGCVGEDPWAEVVLKDLDSAGVGLAGLQRSVRFGTGMMFIPVTPDGQRTLIGRRGANRQLHQPALPNNLIDSCQALHLSGYAFEEEPQSGAARGVLQIAVDAEWFISLDTAYRPAFSSRQELVEVIPHLSLLVLGEPEALSLSGCTDIDDAVGTLLAAGAQRVAVKRGSQGASLHGPNERIDWPAFDVPTIDTTGAGDAFSAGLLHGLLSGLDDKAAALLAMAAGALATTVWGAGAAMPEAAAVRDLIAQETALNHPSYTVSSQAILDLLQP
ncbi:MAG: carbohydrate kinase family protein [Anaerolineales bacterium]